MLETVLEYGTGRAAAIGQFAAGKTGTATNYGDAWFVGWDSKFTVAVWVGYPNKLIPMTTDFNGTPVLGGTFPALIWHDFMVSALQIEKERAEHNASPKAGAGGGTGETSSPSTTGTAGTPSGTGKANGAPTTPNGAGNPTGGGAGGTPEHAAATPTPATPAHEAPSAPTPAPATPGAGATPPTPSPTGGVSPG